jgi:hypothetical protein
VRFVGLRRASFESWVAGVSLAAFHFLGVLAVVWFCSRGSRDAGWELAFVPLFLVDLPVAILAYPLGLGAAWLAREVGVSIDPMLVIVAVANGIVGSLFYLVIPPAVSAHRAFKHGVA